MLLIWLPSTHLQQMVYILQYCWSCIRFLKINSVMLCKMFGSDIKWNMQCMSTAVLFPTALSTEAARMSTWRKISFWAIHRVHAQRPSLTWERWARGCVCPLESTSSSPPPLSPVKRLTLSSESSLRSNQRQSMCLLYVMLMSVYGFVMRRNGNHLLNMFLTIAENWMMKSLPI